MIVDSCLFITEFYSLFISLRRLDKRLADSRFNYNVQNYNKIQHKLFLCQNQGCTTCGSQAVKKWRENEKIKRKWRENEEVERKWRENEEVEKKWKDKRIWRKIHSLHLLILSLFSPSLSISYTKIYHNLSQNVNYGTFVANVTKNLIYTL